MSFVTCENFVLISPDGPMFEPISFCLKEGEILGLVGPNGVGKSLLLNCVATGAAPEPFRWAGKLDTLGRRSGDNTFFLPQLHAPDVHMPYQLGEIASFDGKLSMGLSWFDKKIASRPWNKASGGERMRALLARAFASQAQLLLLDEPFNHLDAYSVSSVRDAMRAYVNVIPSRSIIFVSHLENNSRKNDACAETDFQTVEVISPAFRSGVAL